MLKSLCSIVVPVYNEESNIRLFYDALTGVIDQVDTRAEIIFVDDGSTDRTYEAVTELAHQDGRVRCLRFSRNFGSHAAVMAGLRHAAGDAVIMISVDLQDPPELIPELIARWRDGFQVVWAVREGRDDPLLKKGFAAVFYWLFRRIALPEYPASGMDFGLFDRRIVEKLGSLNELNHFITAMVVWLGFRQTQLFYHRRARFSGQSKFSLGKRIKGAIDAIVSFSFFPIRLISYAGLLVSLASFLYAGFVVVRQLVFGLGGPGWPSLMVAVLFLGGLQLTMLGILGEYIWRVTEQVRGRPLYIVMEATGFDGRDSVPQTEHSLSSVGRMSP